MFRHLILVTITCLFHSLQIYFITNAFSEIHDTQTNLDHRFA